MVDVVADAEPVQARVLRALRVLRVPAEHKLQLRRDRRTCSCWLWTERHRCLERRTKKAKGNFGVRLLWHQILNCEFGARVV